MNWDRSNTGSLALKAWRKNENAVLMLGFQRDTARIQATKHGERVVILIGAEEDPDIKRCSLNDALLFFSLYDLNDADYVGLRVLA